MRASQQKGPLSTETFTIAEWDPQSIEDRHWTVEQCLQAAVLYQSWHDLQARHYPYSPLARRRVREALEWVESDSEWIFASGPICHALGYDIDALRVVFRAVVAKRDQQTEQPQSEYVALANKLLQQSPQPETLICPSRAEALRNRATLSSSIPRMLAGPQSYKFHTRVIGSQVTYWVEESETKRCLYCDVIVMPPKHVCSFHALRSSRKSREKHAKKVNV